MRALKQVLAFGSKTLLQHAIDEALQVFDRVLVVIGAEADAVRSSIADRPVEIVLNEKWQTGMGSSIAAAMHEIERRNPTWSAAALLVADQPLVNAGHLRAMRDFFEQQGAPAIAAQYNNILGVPAFFRQEMFAALAALPPELGARHLLRGSAVKAAPFPLPEAALDIDTPEDFARLEAKSNATS